MTHPIILVPHPIILVVAIVGYALINPLARKAAKVETSKAGSWFYDAPAFAAGMLMAFSLS